MKKDRALILFAKAPVAGQVKTRLIPDFSQQQAAIIHQQLIEYSVTRFCSQKHFDFQLHCSPDSSHRFFQYLRGIYRVECHDQAEGNLGQKMSYALSSTLECYRKVVLIGSDVPAISLDYLESAYAALDENDIVLGPAEDGGYVLVGLSRAKPEMFEQIEWGASRVLQQTIERLQPDYPVLLDTLWDVDRPEDVSRFRQMLRPRFIG